MCNALLGAAIGDALGKVFEGSLCNNKDLVAWDGITFIGSHYHKLGPYQFTDDTILSCALAESLIENDGFDPDKVSKHYCQAVINNPNRGWGSTTRYAIQNIYAGKNYNESGIIGSYGNATAMRISPLAVFYRKNLKELIRFAEIDAKITHVSDEAIAGSLAIALANYFIINNDEEDLLNKIKPYLPDSKLKTKLDAVNIFLKKEISHQKALKIIGTSGDVRETVPAVLYTYLKFNNYRDGMPAIIKMGRDTDSTASILCALYGTKYGISHFDEYHVKNVEDSEKLINLDNKICMRN